MKTIPTGILCVNGPRRGATTYFKEGTKQFQINVLDPGREQAYMGLVYDVARVPYCGATIRIGLLNRIARTK